MRRRADQAHPRAFSIAIAHWAVTIHGLSADEKTWWAGVESVLSIIEVHAGTICACVARSSPLLSYFHPAGCKKDTKLTSWPSTRAKVLNKALQDKSDSVQSWQRLVSLSSSHRSTAEKTPFHLQIELGNLPSCSQKGVQTRRSMRSVYELEAPAETSNLNTRSGSRRRGPVLAANKPQPPSFAIPRFEKNQTLAHQASLGYLHEENAPRAFCPEDLYGYAGSQAPSIMSAAGSRAKQASSASKMSSEPLRHLPAGHLNNPTVEELAKAYHVAAQLQYATQKHFR